MNPKSSTRSSAASIAVSIGEPTGIGPDIILQAWSQRNSIRLPHFTIIGDPGILEERSKMLQLEVPLHEVANGSQAIDCQEALAVIATQKPMKYTKNITSSANSDAVVEAIERGVEMVLAGEFSALTTCPIHKKALYDCGFQFPGHTEFLAFLGKKYTGNLPFPVMMLVGPQLRSVATTIHIALSEVKDALDMDVILQTCRITAGDLRQKFGIPNPVLAIAGVNPHAGESGSIGREEIDIIIPAIRILQNEGINAVGPMPADTMFHKRARDTYDVAICMYHDQALIPAKTLGFDDAVNVTLGLPFIRTSPDHGTASDLTGTGRARPDSFIAALKMAEQMAWQWEGPA
jgi:4-hydroxythreonine-4-phosphate dehydrogenase